MTNLQDFELLKTSQVSGDPTRKTFDGLDYLADP